jgi:4'-phosphopantetheinyl transferase
MVSRARSTSQIDAPHAGIVHIWWSWTLASPARVWKLFQTLSNDECSRALRSPSYDGFQRYVCSRGVLREILSLYTGVEPEQLQIEHGRSGKPYLSSSTQGNLRFSLSHSGELALYAISWGCDVGVDIELITPRHADAGLWASALAPAELDRLSLLPAEECPVAFARTWTQKESVLKATGRGLVYPMTKLDTTAASDGTACTIELDGTWSVIEAPVPDPGYVASLATPFAHASTLARMVPEQADSTASQNGRAA